MTEQAEYLSDVDELMGWSDEPKQVVTEFSGFVMIYDCVLQRYKNLTKAAVHGAMLRYCGMKDNVCKASLKTIGEMIGTNKATVMRYAKELCDDGYFKDLTPNLRNKPHVYADTGVVKISNKTVAEYNATVAQLNSSVAPRNATVAQSQLTIVKKKDSIKINNERKQEAEERIAKQRAEREDRDPVLAMLQGVEENKPIQEMRIRVENALNLNLQNEWDKTRSPWNGYDRKLVKREQETRQTIEQFMEWFNSNKFLRDNQRIWLKPDKIEMWWREAFSKSGDSRYEPADRLQRMG